MQSFNGDNYSKTGRGKYWYKTRWQDRSAMHRDVWEFHNGPLPEKYEVHHSDHNPDNNDILNLVALPKPIHASYHGRLNTRVPREAIAKAPEWHRSPEGREWHRKHGRAIYATRKLVQFVCQQCGKQFESRARGNVRFCHPNCKASALRARRKADRAD